MSGMLAGAHKFYLSGRKNKMQDLSKEEKGIIQFMPLNAIFNFWKSVSHWNRDDRMLYLEGI